MGEYLSSNRDSPFFDRGVLRKMKKAVDTSSEQTTKDIGELDQKDISEAKAAFAKVGGTAVLVFSLSSCNTGFGVVLRSDGTRVRAPEVEALVYCCGRWTLVYVHQSLIISPRMQDRGRVFLIVAFDGPRLGTYRTIR